MLSAAKHLSDHCDRPFAEFTLSGANGIRVTKHYQYWLLKFIIALVPSLNRGASEARSYRYTMNQEFSAQVLTSIVGATLAVALVTNNCGLTIAVALVKYESEF